MKSTAHSDQRQPLLVSFLLSLHPLSFLFSTSLSYSPSLLISSLSTFLFSLPFIFPPHFLSQLFFSPSFFSPLCYPPLLALFYPHLLISHSLFPYYLFPPPFLLHSHYIFSVLPLFLLNVTYLFSPYLILYLPHLSCFISSPHLFLFILPPFLLPSPYL